LAHLLIFNAIDYKLIDYVDFKEMILDAIIREKIAVFHHSHYMVEAGINDGCNMRSENNNMSHCEAESLMVGVKLDWQ